MNNVYDTIQNNLCLSCGICVNVCPKKCITFNKKGIAQIDNNSCENCGLCKKYCPGISSNSICGNTIENRMRGTAIASYVGRTKNLKRLKNAVSGGVATEIICTLLEEKKYDYAAGVKNRYFNQKNIMQIYSINEYQEDFQRSVYTMPSYEDVITYIKNNPHKKGIIIGTGCVISAIKKYISANHLCKDNFLFVGLFCDCTLDNNIEIYFSNYASRFKHQVTGFDFRSKEYGSYWPGDVKLNLNDNSIIMLPREERYKVVKYFKHQRCIYCLDHMNVNADISLGDNYTEIHSDKLGSNSIVIRTQKGMQDFESVKKQLITYDIGYSVICASQNIDKKFIHAEFSKFLEKKTKISINLLDERMTYTDKINGNPKEEYKKTINQIKMGRAYLRLPQLFELIMIIRGDSSIFNRNMVKKILKKRKTRR